MDRATKLHQREFEVLPEIWSKLNDAYGATQGLAGGFFTTPDFSQMTEEKFDLLMAELEFTDYERRELRSAPERRRGIPK